MGTSLKASLSRKFGPLKGWQWLAIIGGALLIYGRLRPSSAASGIANAPSSGPAPSVNITNVIEQPSPAAKPPDPKKKAGSSVPWIEAPGTSFAGTPPVTVQAVAPTPYVPTTVQQKIAASASYQALPAPTQAVVMRGSEYSIPEYLSHGGAI